MANENTDLKWSIVQDKILPPLHRFILYIVCVVAAVVLTAFSAINGDSALSLILGIVAVISGGTAIANRPQELGSTSLKFREPEDIKEEGN